MSSLSETEDRAERLVSESVTAVPGSHNAASMASGEPGCPMAFVWRGTEFRVSRVLASDRTLRPCRNGSGETYVDKHLHTVETESGEIMTLYRKRTGSAGDSWILYTIRRPKTRSPIRIAVLVSGGGSNLQSLIDAAERDGDTARYDIALVIADREGSGAIERAKRHGIPTALALPPAGVPRPQAREAVSDRVLALARESGVEAIVLAGFLTIFSGELIEAFSGRIVNIHPALLPKFGGKGMWGHHVHEAVLAAGETESGCTVHLVDSGCDTGPVLLQKRVPVLPGDTAETLAARILLSEHRAIVEGVNALHDLLRPERSGE